VIKAALPFMRAQRSGTIINFSSIAGFAAGPSSAAYSMSKFAVEGMLEHTIAGSVSEYLLTNYKPALSESLFVELGPFNIRVLLVEPGAFRTNFIGFHKLPAAGMTKDYEGTPLGNAMELFNGFAGRQPGDPAKAAQRVLDVIQLQGMGQGKEKLLRLPLGIDCFPRMLGKIENMKVELEQMRVIALSTAIDSE
jgi:NAD(P)-dependent dehydrogenase (short-subunit alcohol dehydrogenase family)